MAEYPDGVVPALVGENERLRADARKTDQILLALASAAIIQARDACYRQGCGLEGMGAAGSRNRPIRCSDCPMDRVDDVWDLVYGQDPDPEIDT